MRHEAIRLAYPDAGVINGENEVWDKSGNVIHIDESLVQEKFNHLVTAYNAQAYARSRQTEYPPLADQLDHIFHNGVASWKTNVVQPVKDKYPKG